MSAAASEPRPTAFERLHPSVRYMVREVLRFPALRPVQAATIEPILDGRDCVVIAPTAGGKTEAATFPVLSRILQERLPAVAALYICPLRALLNNQEARLQRMAEATGLRVGKWHGDVPAALKRSLVAEPPELLMITPESLEVLLISPSTAERDRAAALLSHVRLAIIDEVHAFAADSRGAHLVSILERLQLRSGGHIQRIGLSATVGNPAALARWLQGSGATSEPVVVSPGGPRKKPIFRWQVAQGSLAAATLIRDLGHTEKKLVFVESRSRAEELARSLQAVGVKVWVHHSSVGRDAREEAELQFEGSPDATLVATSSMELGIDVGDLDHIFQLDAPATVSSLAQRLGRTGRRPDTSPRMTFVADAPEDLLLSMALVSRFEEGWIEDSQPSTRAWTVAVHQVFANLLETGGSTREALLCRLRPVPSFADIRLEEWTTFLNYLVAEGWLDQADGALLLGRRAEKQFGARSFFRLYAVFESPGVLTVRHGNQDIGTIQAWFAGQLLGRSKTFRLAGRAWAADEIDLQRGFVRARPAASGVVPAWTGRPAGFSRPVCESILRLLSETGYPEGLSEAARGWVDHARDQLDTVPFEGRSRPLVQEPDRVVWYTFAGSRINLVLSRLIEAETSLCSSISNLSVKLRGPVGIVEGAAMKVVGQLATGDLPNMDEWAAFDPMARAMLLSSFQSCLPATFEQEYLRAAFLDIEGAKKWAAEVDVGLSRSET